MRMMEMATLAVSIVALLVILTVMTMQVVWRYILSSPLRWSEPVSVYALVWLVFMGAAVLAIRGEHVSIPSLTDRLPTKARIYARVFSNVCTLAFALLIVWLGWNWLSTGAHTLAAGLGFSTRWIKIAIPIAFAVVAVAALRLAASDLGALMRGERTSPTSGKEH